MRILEVLLYKRGFGYVQREMIEEHLREKYFAEDEILES